MKEFNEANLLFAVMDEHVWGKASVDTVALQGYYNSHHNNYTWAASLTALTVSSPNKTVVDSIAAGVRQTPAAWRDLVKTYSTQLTADSSRFENGQLPLKQQVPMQAGFASAIEQNDAGDAWTFVYVFNVYPQPQPRNFEDAKGMVINDYQTVLESQWLETIKKKYPVKVNEDVVKGLR
jgi:peptidyl-prolyl cis-trans isomerase SurA